MTQHQEQANAQEIAAEIDAQIRALSVRNTPNVRAIRRRYSRRFKQADPAFILDLDRELIQNYDHRWVAYELTNHHQAAFQTGFKNPRWNG